MIYLVLYISFNYKPRNFFKKCVEDETSLLIICGVMSLFAKFVGIKNLSVPQLTPQRI